MYPSLWAGALGPQSSTAAAGEASAGAGAMAEQSFGCGDPKWFHSCLPWLTLLRITS